MPRFSQVGAGSQKSNRHLSLQFLGFLMPLFLPWGEKEGGDVCIGRNGKISLRYAEKEKYGVMLPFSSFDKPL